MRVAGCLAATLLILAASVAAQAATRSAPAQQLQDSMRTTLAAVSQGGVPAQLAPPEENTLRAGMTERFNASLEARIGGCNQKTATAIADALAPHISPNLVEGAMGAWQHYDEMTGGRHIGVRVGLGKEFLGYSNRQPVEDHWISFQVNVGLFGPHRSCNR